MQHKNKPLFSKITHFWSNDSKRLIQPQTHCLQRSHYIWPSYNFPCIQRTFIKSFREYFSIINWKKKIENYNSSIIFDSWKKFSFFSAFHCASPIPKKIHLYLMALSNLTNNTALILMPTWDNKMLLNKVNKRKFKPGANLPMSKFNQSTMFGVTS